jgi:hypothetical protein
LHLNEQRSFEEIENLVKQYEQIDECFKVMGNACYMIVSHFEPAELNALLKSSQNGVVTQLKLSFEK